MGYGSSSFCVITKHKTEQQNYYLYFLTFCHASFLQLRIFMDKTFIKK